VSPAGTHSSVGTPRRVSERGHSRQVPSSCKYSLPFLKKPPAPAYGISWLLNGTQLRFRNLLTCDGTGRFSAASLMTAKTANKRGI
jgi:hypothetical protein